MSPKRGETPPSEAAASVVVAGDVCIDWLSIPVEPKHPDPSSGETCPNWQLSNGRRMFAVPGGAWLTGDMTRAALGAKERVRRPAIRRHLESAPPEEILHSFLTLEPCERERDKRKSLVWTLKRYEGYTGPAPEHALQVLGVVGDTAAAALVVLDDAGNGYRDSTPEHWPAALRQSQPLVLYKVRSPLDKGSLWEYLKAHHLDRTIALISVENLRSEGADISHGLSWERTVTDLILALSREPRFNWLCSCRYLVLPLAIEGALLLCCAEGKIISARLWYVPDLAEGELPGGRYGNMPGFGSALCAAVAASLAGPGGGLIPGSSEMDQALRRGIGNGIRAMHRLLDLGFGPCGAEASGAPAYPGAEIFSGDPTFGLKICDVAVPLPRVSSDKKDKKIETDEEREKREKQEIDELDKFRAWRIIDSKRTASMIELAEKAALYGAAKVFPEIPVGRFGKLETLDRVEIGTYRSTCNLVREFLRNPRPERPLCIAVFGPPGSGKSFGVTQVALSVAKNLAGDGEVEIEKLEFNVSQWSDPSQLIPALHRVRDSALRGRVPLVFFDEFDSRLETQELGWLKSFLAPMQDGVFSDGLTTHQVGKAVFVFAGGTASTFAAFNSQAKPAACSAGAKGPGLQKKDPASERARAAKLPDFLSRLRGHVDVFGFSPAVDTNLVRRALVLRSIILRKFPTLADPRGRLRIDPGVLRAFLKIPEYIHGARSLEAILEMSRLVGRSRFDPSLLPPAQQLNLHVIGEAFVALVRHHQTLGGKLEEIARRMHEKYLAQAMASGKAKFGDRPALQPWDLLDGLYKNSNREQVANYPALLAAAGCGFEDGEADPGFIFRPKEIDTLARMEHARWVDERRLKQPDHPDLCAWDDLSAEERQKDVDIVVAIPKVLGEVGLRVVRLDPS